MKLSNYLIFTLREDPKDAEVVSHKLMIRAGMIYKEESGLYGYLPIGLKVYNKVVNIIREEMNKSGAIEALPTILTPASLWVESGRYDTMGKEMIKIKDRRDNWLVLGPTHEEAFTDIVRRTINSYRQLPITLYQIAKKFRDEIRPRFGVMRCREFTMKDAYSFDVDQKGLDESYNKMKMAYTKIFKRVGLKTLPVEADVGSMGGTKSEEFMVFSSIGEATIIHCPNCNYYANVERAESILNDDTREDEYQKELKEVDTPGVSTIEELTKFFNTSPKKFIKTIIYIADGKPVAVLIRGDLDINEVKLKNYLGAIELELATPEIIEEVTSAKVGFAGPIGLRNNTRVIGDISIKNIVNGITGANKTDKHLINVNIGRDFNVSELIDIRISRAGDICKNCGSVLEETKGIEVGHIFKLGYKYTKSMNITVLDKSGNRVNPIMGCYGIGVDRTIAAVVETNNDEKGIIWPITIAPFECVIVPISTKDEKVMKISNDIYEKLLNIKVDVAIDDRDETLGVRLNDMDLIGIPFKIIVGKRALNEGKIEIKVRSNGKTYDVPIDKAVSEIKLMIEEEIKKYEQ